MTLFYLNSTRYLFDQVLALILNDVDGTKSRSLKLLLPPLPYFLHSPPLTMIPDVHSEYQNIGAARMGVHQVNAVGIRFAVVDLGTYSYNMTQPIIGRLLRSSSWTDLLQKG